MTYPLQPAYYQTDVYSRLSSELITSAAQGRRPWFLWTTFVAPHFSIGEAF